MFNINGRQISQSEISSAQARVYANGKEVYSSNCQVLSPGEVKLLIPPAVLPEKEMKLQVIFKITTSESGYEKSIEFQTGKSQFDVEADYQQLLQLCPDLEDYAWQDDPLYSRQRQTALDEIYQKLVLNNGERDKNWQKHTLVLPFLHLWLSHIFNTLSKTQDDTFSARKEEFYEKYMFLIRDIQLDPKSPVSARNRTKLMRG